jgi:hypothetical protein
MGWYGSYNNSTEVLEETERGARQQNCEILDKKVFKSYGALLYKTLEDKIYIDYFIFKGDSYKPLLWTDGAKRIPKKWIKQVLPFADEFTLKMYEANK